MYTAVLIRRHINRLDKNRPFSIRDFLNYGSRSAVDQVFYWLVKKGHISRIARGVFLKENAPIPSIVDVALVKAKAFGKNLSVHGAEAAKTLGLNPKSKIRETNREKDLEPNRAIINESLFACNGPSSSFRFGNTRIRFMSCSGRKMNTGKDLLGLILLALWHNGKSACSSEIVYNYVLLFNRNDRQNLRQRIKILPTWLAKYFDYMF